MTDRPHLRRFRANEALVALSLGRHVAAVRMHSQADESSG